MEVPYNKYKIGIEKACKFSDQLEYLLTTSWISLYSPGYELSPVYFALSGLEGDARGICVRWGVAPS
jgi:hypothetical protein